jgi:hypothetical protein
MTPCIFYSAKLLFHDTGSRYFLSGAEEKKLRKSDLLPYHFKLCTTYVFDKVEELSNYVYPNTNTSISDV